jgi:hypothetical protein
MNSPRADYYEHPVFHPKRILLETSAMKGLKAEIDRWLWTGATGAVVLGMSRVGKTTAVKTACSQLYTRGKVKIPAYYASTPSRDQRTILSVFRQLCWSANLRVTTHDRADHLSQRFVHYIVDNAAEAMCEQVVLFVDEMQRLSPEQFNAFAEIYDKAWDLGIALMVIFVGNEQESSRLLGYIEQPGYAHIRGRFFTQRYTFRGLTSKAEVEECLEKYDELRYPIDGPTYTGFFLPDAVRKGWRLTSLSGDIWRIFHSYQLKYHIDSWGMQYFVATVNTLLSDFLPHHGVDKFDDDMVHECIRISGLIPSLVVPAE